MKKKIFAPLRAKKMTSSTHFGQKLHERMNEKNRFELVVDVIGVVTKRRDDKKKEKAQH